MKNNRKDAQELLVDMKDLYKKVVDEGAQTFKKWKPKIERKNFEKSAENLSYYLALRRRDIRGLQEQLAPLGLSSLGRLESNTKSSLENVIAQLSLNAGEETNFTTHTLHSFTKGRKSLENNTEQIYGPKPDDRNTRIMVTMPSKAAKDVEFIENLMNKGMDVARINLAHDNEDAWENMIQNIKKASENTNSEVQIMMDISGPKIRTDWVFTYLKKPKVVVGDYIRITKDYENLPKEDFVKVTAGCNLSQVFNSLNVGDSVSIDDGSVETEVDSLSDEEAILEVKHVKGNNKRIKAEKGLNFPETNLELDIITEEDKKDIKFAVENADIFGCSFIRDGKDMEKIQAEIENVVGNKASEVKIMAKIETVQAVEKLPEIILTAAGKNPFSVMVG